jgi:hypothetical protein
VVGSHGGGPAAAEGARGTGFCGVGSRSRELHQSVWTYRFGGQLRVG